MPYVIHMSHYTFFYIINSSNKKKKTVLIKLRDSIASRQNEDVSRLIFHTTMNCCEPVAFIFKCRKRHQITLLIYLE